MQLHFENRAAAGRALGAALLARGRWHDPLVLALPRGGVPVAREVARALHAPWDLLLVRKLGAPGQPELALGALAEDGTLELNHALVRQLGVDPAWIDEAARTAARELRRRAGLWRGAREAAVAAGRDVIVVDDGVATGASMRVALRALRAQHPARIVAAAPVAPPDVDFSQLADAFVCLARPRAFSAVGAYYADFAQVDDDAVREQLAEAAQPAADAHSGASAFNLQAELRS